MSIFDENMAYLDKSSHVLYQQVKQKLDEKMQCQIKADICRNKRDELNIKVDDGTREYFVHSTYNADAEAVKWTASVDNNADMIVVFGLGLGYHIEKLREITRKETIIYVIEPSVEIFRLFMEYRRLSEIFTDREFSLIIGELPENSAIHIFNAFKNVLLGKIEFAVFSIYKSLYGSHFDTIKQVFMKYIKMLNANIITTEYFEYLWIKNYLMNVLHMDGAINGRHLYGKLGGKPAIIVSAGPSLNKNIGLLEKAKNKAAIFAAGSSFRILMNHGITPNFTVAMDGSPLIKDIYRDLDTNDTILLYTNQVDSDTLQMFTAGKVIFITDGDKLCRQFGEKMGIDFEIIDSDHTVAGICVSIASFMGCNPIILIGQDFACTDLEFHADGAAHMINFKEDKAKEENKMIQMKDIYGKDTYTLPSLLSAKISMEAKVLKSVKAGHQFINATEGGIGVENCVNMTFTDVIQKYINNEFDIRDSLNEIINDIRYAIKIDPDKLRLHFDYLEAETALLKTKAIALSDLCEKAKKELTRKTVRPERYNALAKGIIEEQSNIEKSEFYNEYTLLAISQSIAIHKIISDNNVKNKSDIVEKNLCKVEYIKKQMTEICEFCNFIESFIQNVYDPFYKEALRGQ